MPVIRFPSALKYYVDNQSELAISGSTVSEIMETLVTRYPSLKFHLLDSDGKLRRHFSVFVNGEHVRELNGMHTRLTDEDNIILVASAAGG